MESDVAARGTGTRTKGGQSVKKQRNGTFEVDAAALNRLLAGLVAMRDGNFRRRLTVSGDGAMAEIAAVFNEVADRNVHLTGELARVRRVVGREGKLTERLETGACEGSWAAAIDASNELVDDLARRSRRSGVSCRRWPTVIWSSGWSSVRTPPTKRYGHCAASS